MATLTTGTAIGGFQDGFPSPSLALLHTPCQLSHVPIDRLHGIESVVVIDQPLPAYRGSRVDVGYTRFIHVIL